MKNTILLIIVGVIAFLVVPKAAWLWMAVGVVVGWNVLEQPTIVKEYFDIIVDLVKKKLKIG